MAKRVNQDPRPNYGLDWDSIVRHYLRFPHLRKESWEDTVLQAVATGLPIPTVDAVADRPNFRMLGPDFGNEKLHERQNGTKTKELEERYRLLERKY